MTGLIFVGISINLAKILATIGLADRALLSLQLLLNVLITSILFLVPEQTMYQVGIEILITGCCAYVFIFYLDLRIFKHKRYKLLYGLYFLLDHVATVPVIITGIALTTGVANGAYWIVPAILFSIIKAVIDGWVLLVEINR